MSFIDTNMLHKCLIVFLIATNLFNIKARRFNNPVIDNGNWPDPGAIKVGDLYYAVTTSVPGAYEKYPIHKSSDLENWELIGYTFNSSNFPTWSDINQEFWAPELHKVGDKYHVYFSARDTATKILSIGVATSTNIEGPYTSLPKALYTHPTTDCWDGTLINDNGTLYLAWVTHGDDSQTRINGRRLNPEGLGFPDDVTVELLRPDLDWEDHFIEAPYYVRKGDYHYLMYSAGGMCTGYSVGVTRSKNILGPYIKRGDPILKETDPFRAPGHNSVVKDQDGVNDIIVYHSFKKNQVCEDHDRVMLVSSMGWGEDKWPYVFDNE